MLLKDMEKAEGYALISFCVETGGGSSFPSVKIVKKSKFIDNLRDELVKRAREDADWIWKTQWLLMKKGILSEQLGITLRIQTLKK